MPERAPSRSHGQATPREPWEYSEEAQSAFLKINKIRYRLLPYLYSTAWETHREGIPMMRAMLLEFSEDLNVSEISTQYMLGRSLLVAPVFDKKKHMVYYMLYSTYSLAAFYQSNVIGVIIKTA